MKRRFAQNPAYMEYESLLIDLHVMIARGNAESSDAEHIRERMDGLVSQFDAAEMDRLDGLSADLYMLSNNEINLSSEKALKPVAEFHREVLEAQQRNDWEGVLKLLRQRPLSSPLPGVAISRYKAYHALGQPKAALLFLEFAARATPGESGLAALRLFLLREMGEEAQAVAEANKYLEESGASPEAKVAAADVLFDESASAAKLGRITSLLNGVLGSSQTIQPSFAILAWILLAGCYAATDRRNEAIGAFDRALQLTPGDRAVTAAREALVATEHGGAGIPAFKAALHRARMAAEDVQLQPRTAA